MSALIVGLTGGIASGKSTLEAAFRALGVTVADADVAAREAVALGSDGLAEVVARFGPSVLMADGHLDRAAMRQRVFTDANAKHALEAIVHPRVRARLEADCAAARSPYAIASIPLLAEGGGRITYPWLQRILLVDVPADVQLARLLQRDGINAALAQQMLAAQASRQQRLALADDVIVNVQPPEVLPAQVAALDRLYRHLLASVLPAGSPVQ